MDISVYTCTISYDACEKDEKSVSEKFTVYTQLLEKIGWKPFSVCNHKKQYVFTLEYFIECKVDLFWNLYAVSTPVLRKTLNCEKVSSCVVSDIKSVEDSLFENTRTYNHAGFLLNEPKVIECKICFLNTAQVMYSVCKHFGACFSCANRIGTKCPFCNIKSSSITRPRGNFFVV